MPTTETIPTFTISGHVFDTFNAPISGVKIQAYDKDLRNEQPLGKATVTDSAGLYSITFNSLEAAAAELKTPDVFIRVFDNIGKPLGQSQIVFNISFPAVIDFKVGNTEIKPLNEFDSLVKILQPLVTAAKLQFKDLTEKEPLHDISFLAGETGEDTTHIDFLVKAYQLADAANKSLTPANLPPATNAPVVINISPAFFYALLRDGFPSSLNELLHTQ